MCMCACVRVRKVHVFQLVYLQSPVKLERAGCFWLAVKCTEQNMHFDCLECKHRELVCVSLCVLDCVCMSVCMCVCVMGLGERERRKLSWELAPFGGNANVL